MSLLEKALASHPLSKEIITFVERRKTNPAYANYKVVEVQLVGHGIVGVTHEQIGTEYFGCPKTWTCDVEVAIIRNGAFIKINAGNYVKTHADGTSFLQALLSTTQHGKIKDARIAPGGVIRVINEKNLDSPSKQFVRID